MQLFYTFNAFLIPFTFIDSFVCYIHIYSKLDASVVTLFCGFPVVSRRSYEQGFEGSISQVM